MEWKKEKMSAAELERRQKEYMNAAMSMCKRSHAPEAAAAAAAPEPEEPVRYEPKEPVQNEPKEPVQSEPEAPTAEAAEPAVTGQPEEQQGPGSQPAPEPENDPNYGVYTAEELLKGENDSEGLKKAAEILEEMTRSTEMMKKLASEDEEEGTTDFPDFSCDTDGEEDDCFREDTGSPEDECPPSDGDAE